MTKMQKANSVLEKDRNEWHERWKGSTQKCLQLTELSQATTNELKTVQKKLDALEKLCRKLQTERAYYLQQLKVHNISAITPVDEESHNNIVAVMPGTSRSDPGVVTAVTSSVSQSEQSSGEHSGDSSINSSEPPRRKVNI